MLSSEKRSLVRFLILYLTSTFILFAIATALYYNSTKQHILQKQKESLKATAMEIIASLEKLHHSSSKTLLYPRIKGVNSAIFDLDKRYIFGTFSKEVALHESFQDKLTIIQKIQPYYLGAAYLLVQKEIDYQPILKLQRQTLLFMILAGAVFVVLGYFLGRLFIAPMREALQKINHFIQDATHELNTPISTILTNIEMIQTLKLCTKANEPLRRIQIASKTLSRIYDDLSYLNLNHNYHRNIQTINLSELLQERLYYFHDIIASKKIQLLQHIEDSVMIKMDRNDAIRLFDNLISNAIKYNVVGGSIEVVLNHHAFRVSDSGVGIEKSKLQTITKRFIRANTSEGGFGIGLNIVQQVVSFYNFELQILSQKDQGTTVEVLWQN